MCLIADTINYCAEKNRYFFFYLCIIFKYETMKTNLIVMVAQPIAIGFTV